MWASWGWNYLIYFWRKNFRGIDRNILFIRVFYEESIKYIIMFAAGWSTEKPKLTKIWPQLPGFTENESYDRKFDIIFGNVAKNYICPENFKFLGLIWKYKSQPAATLYIISLLYYSFNWLQRGPLFCVPLFCTILAFWNYKIRGSHCSLWPGHSSTRFIPWKFPGEK